MELHGAATSPSDFDMALRMRMSPNGQELLVTGAMNRTHIAPMVLGAQFPSYASGLSLNPTTLVRNWHRGFSRDPALTPEDRYGIDIWRGASGETFVLFNEYDANAQQAIQFGVTVVSPAGTINTSVPDLHSFYSAGLWANQALPGGGPPTLNRLMVFGHAEGWVCNFPGSLGTAAPQPSNVVPFTTELTCNYNPATLIFSTSVTPIRMQPTYWGTVSTSGYDYGQSGGLLNDVRRMHTPAITEDYGGYNGVKGYNLISPFINGFSTGLLNFKFNRVLHTGAQPLCYVPYEDECVTSWQAYPTLGSGNINYGVQPITMQQGPDLEVSYLPYTQSGCSAPNSQRPAADGGVGTAGLTASALESVSSDPASDNATIQFAGAVASGAPVAVSVFNMQGQQVASHQAAGSGGQAITIPLPDLAPGVYILRATVSGDARSQGGVKLVIR